MNRADTESVKSVIREVGTRLNLECGVFANEARRDGTAVALWNSDGWFIRLHGGRHRTSDYSRPEVTFSVDGMFAHPGSGLAEYLTAHGVPSQNVRHSGRLRERDALVDHIVNTMAPAIADHSARLLRQIERRERARVLTRAARDRLGFEAGESEVRADVSSCQVKIRVSTHQTDPDNIVAGMDLFGLSPDDVDAVLALLRARKSH
ncbi:hypothetical protein [Burkholderia cenocepacia]|uniref:hypothetical protein n=1 Tax=Burkholderia cenocepacia TaxID=95486 RepID=UPI00076D36BE|nr:hypothetical protein [Burkholderia cenocepacia]KWU26333.1 hypothetical protein AS149_25425 [Burkholderia cenocepacia]